MKSGSGGLLTEQAVLELSDSPHLLYDLLEEVGQGTYGLVHKAQWSGDRDTSVPLLNFSSMSLSIRLKGHLPNKA